MGGDGRPEGPPISSPGVLDGGSVYSTLNTVTATSSATAVSATWNIVNTLNISEFDVYDEHVGIYPDDVYFNDTIYSDFYDNCFEIKNNSPLSKLRVVYESPRYDDYIQFYDELIIFKELILPKLLEENGRI